MKRKKSTLKIILLILFSLLVTIATISALVITNYLDKINKVELNQYDVLNSESSDNINSDEVDKEELSSYTNIKIDKKIRNIALFGIDESDNNIGRSDCIMILTIDTIHNKLKLSSIIRDSYVDIPSRYGKDKINHAYAFGGPTLAVKTLNNTFDLDITDFASVNFSSFPKVIDTLGGITLNITEDELQYINKYISQLNSINNTNEHLIETTGTQTVNGTQALAYSRIRYTEGGDFERSHRQRIVIDEAFKKGKELSITDYPKLLSQILPSIKTNLNNTELLSIALDINSLKDTELLQNRFPEDDDGEGKMIDGVYYYVFDEDKTTSKIHSFIYEN